MSASSTVRPLRVAYLINQYPKVSHTFIRREILALERLGLAVLRIALRGWDAPALDEADTAERAKTRYVLLDGVGGLLAPVMRCLLTAPRQTLSALRTALRLSRRGDRPWPYHLVYWAEACLVAEWARASGVAHVHAHFGTNGAEVALLASTIGGLTYSFTVHGPEEFDKPEALKLAEKGAGAAFVVAVSSYGRSQLYRWIDTTHWPRIHVVHCGLDRQFLADKSEAASASDALVCVGRLAEQKGHLLLLEAVRILALEGVAVKLVLAGDGELRPAIERFIALNGLQESVRITGWIGGEQVKRELIEAGAFVLPSFAEGLPVALMEAMAMRRPVLTTYVAGIPELVLDGQHGWLFPAGSAQAIAEAVRRFIDTPVSQRQAIGRAARQRVLERHDIDTEAAKLRDLFAAVVPESMHRSTHR